MRRSFTLIELIFSMVIIAIAFTFLPKILQLSTKASTQSIREEAMFSAVALLGLIKATAWDEKNSEYDDILLVNNGNTAYECNNNGYRVGGFLGSRNCEHKVEASTLGVDSGEPPYDDLDDFTSVNANNYNSSRSYKLSVKVDFVEDLSLNDEVFKDENFITPNSTNTKYMVIDVNSTKKTEQLRKNIARFVFCSFNIGQIHINRLSWYE